MLEKASKEEEEEEEEEEELLSVFGIALLPIEVFAASPSSMLVVLLPLLRLQYVPEKKTDVLLALAQYM